RSRVKVPSAPALYKLASVDAFKSPARVCHVYRLVDPPQPPPPVSNDGGPAGTAAPGKNPAAGKIPDARKLPPGGGGRRGGGREELGEEGGVEGTGHPDIPPVFVLNVQLPDVPTPLSAQGDGATIHVVYVFHATEQLRRF
ncbi:unnamed protein product, partial [Discosporangium mesarthrocarpum]